MEKDWGVTPLSTWGVRKPVLVQWGFNDAQRNKQLRNIVSKILFKTVGYLFSNQ